jgi:hypothetical protein
MLSDSSSPPGDLEVAVDIRVETPVVRGRPPRRAAGNIDSCRRKEKVEHSVLMLGKSVQAKECGFSLAEYARSSAKSILLRTSAGPILGDNPWNGSPP